MDMPKIKHGCFFSKGGVTYPQKKSNYLHSSFKDFLFLTASLNVRARGCPKIRYFITLLLSRILPFYSVEGSKGALQGCRLLSAPRKFYDTTSLWPSHLRSNEKERSEGPLMEDNK